MFGIFVKRARSQRTRLRQDFERVTAALCRADASTQRQVGRGINLANTRFVDGFVSETGFRRARPAERRRHLRQLGIAEAKAAKETPHLATGFALFRMWLGAVSGNDGVLLDQLTKALVFFSEKADDRRQTCR